ncbi:MAG: erythromycin esterase family protein [Steroidobacteraceae bacterium]
MKSNSFSRPIAAALAAAFICVSQTACVAQKTGTTAKPPDTTEAVTQWLAAHAIPLSSVEAGAGFDDLRPLERILKDTRIVALGETSHGTREIFQFKHRMVEFLVTRMGFDALTIEASYPACMKINDYVVYGKGDPAQALAGQGFSQFDSQEILALIEWLRRHNSALPQAQRVRLLGHDMQTQLQPAIDGIVEYLQRVAPDHVAEAKAALAPFEAGRGGIGALPAEEQVTSQARLQALHSFLAARRDEFVQRTTAWEFDVVLLYARVMAQNASFIIAVAKNKQPPGVYEAYGLRDAYMAENVGAQLRMLGPNARIIVSSHNGHVQTGHWGGGIPSLSGASIAAMGEFLRDAYGPAYYVIGSDFNRGAFQALGDAGLREFVLPPAPQGSLAWYLSAAGRAREARNYFVDFRWAPTRGPVAQWLASPVPITVLTGAFADGLRREQIQAPIMLRQYFDAMVFMEETTPARSNPKSSGN